MNDISLIPKIIDVFEKGNGENDAEGVDPPIFATKTDEPRSDRLGLFSFSQPQRTPVPGASSSME